MNRKGIILLLVWGLSLLLISITYAQVKFKDMPDDHWAARSVYNMVRLGVTRGYPDGTFRGEEKISRYDLMVYLSNLEIAMEQMMDNKIAAAGSGGGAVTSNKILEELRAEVLTSKEDLRAEVSQLRKVMLQYFKEQGYSVPAQN